MTRHVVHAAAYAMLAALALASSAFAASASAVLTVESVLPPAWVERANARREPLTVGMALANKEKVHTGDGGRAMLRMAEGSAVKLGEGATLSVDDLVEKPDAKGGVVGASLDVVRGAFRFTTGLLGNPKGQRDVRVRVNAVTAGIRGTDVWGKSDMDRDIVCLLEGRINVSHGAAQFQMTEPNSFYIAPRTGQAQPPSRVTPQQVREWSAETEIDPKTGATRRGGALFVVVVPGTDERTANAQRDKLRDSGFPADVTRVGDRHEVRIASIADATEAGVLAQRMQRLGYKQARPGK
ncbi:MAG TPA: FecR domain-containing protein [Burkholderiales bacterium]|nr:FecR domain-containing protein [Burkholderiales bacterium]